MVYRGKPSAACGECRKRRTRCDLAVPACGQCIRTKRVCPGYRTAPGLVIFDQSKQVAQKSKTQDLALRHASSTGGSSKVIQYESGISDTKPEITFLQPIGVAYNFVLEDLAVKHFMDHYIGQDKNSAQFGYLPDYYTRQGFNCSELQASLKAVGLAGYARSVGRADLLYPATRSYVAAVRNVNQAMSGSNLAGREATLISVMLLSLFEVMILPRASGLENLTKHLKGAMSIAHLTIKKTRLAETYRKLLGTVIQAVVIAYWIQNEPLPTEFYKLKEEAFFHPDSIHAQFLHIVIELMRYRDALNEGSFTSPQNATEEAQSLDNIFKQFTKGLSRHARYDLVDVPKSSQEPVYNRFYHVYPSSIAAHLWNNLRLSRIYIHRTMLEQLSARFDEATEPDERSSIVKQVTTSQNLIEDLAADICASVPQLADYIEQLPPYVDRDMDNIANRFTVPKYVHGQPLLSLSLTTATVELSAHFIYDPGPFRYTSRVKHEDGPTPRPASLYHAYYQLSKLEPIQSLPVHMTDWIQTRLRWIEERGDPDDLELMKALVRRSRANQDTNTYNSSAGTSTTNG